LPQHKISIPQHKSKPPFLEEQIHDLNPHQILGGLTNAKSKLQKAYWAFNNRRNVSADFKDHRQKGDPDIAIRPRGA
jgi:hypothetical protein